MHIKDFAGYEKIIIQCHDVPDADTIASGFALQHYLQSFGREPRLVYGGKAGISKPNLLLMLSLMNIKIEHVNEIKPCECDLLITVDCQYSAGNVKFFPAKNFAVIDHHHPEINEGENVCIRPSLGSCSTLVWDLLRAEDYNIGRDPDLCNALYYGLFTDTNGLAEITHPLDRDMAEILPADTMLIKKLKNSAITLNELDIVGGTLSAPEMLGNIGLFEAEPCDPNILGFTSDIAQQVQQIDCCVVFCPLSGGLKLSIRSSVREIMANEFAAFLSKDVGSGGGTIEKAGSFLNYSGIEKKYGNIKPTGYLRKRIEEYNANYDYIYCGNNTVDFNVMKRYRKLPKTVSFVHTADIFPEGTPIIVRTLEGDIDTRTDGDIFIMIGIYGEVYPIERFKFEKSYQITDEESGIRFEYPPNVTNKVTGEKKNLLPFAKSCVPVSEKIIRAEMVKRDTKVFSHWDKEKYFYGVKGDYIAANENDYSDIYIIRNDIFIETYEEI